MVNDERFYLRRSIYTILNHYLMMIRFPPDLYATRSTFTPLHELNPPLSTRRTLSPRSAGPAEKVPARRPVSRLQDGTVRRHSGPLARFTTPRPRTSAHSKHQPPQIHSQNKTSRRPLPASPPLALIENDLSCLLYIPTLPGLQEATNTKEPKLYVIICRHGQGRQVRDGAV
jgi:hypothetical protein